MAVGQWAWIHFKHNVISGMWSKLSLHWSCGNTSAFFWFVSPNLGEQLGGLSERFLLIRLPQFLWRLLLRFRLQRKKKIPSSHTGVIFCLKAMAMFDWQLPAQSSRYTASGHTHARACYSWSEKGYSVNTAHVCVSQFPRWPSSPHLVNQIRHILESRPQDNSCRLTCWQMVLNTLPVIK